MFLGEYSHSLDSKGRLTVPAKFRDQVAAGLVVTRNPAERCLLMMPLSEWSVLTEKTKQLPLTDPRSALLRRALFSAAEDLKPDKQGRILISQRLRDFAYIGTEIQVVGMDTYIELWDPTHWNEQILKQIDSSEISAELFANLNI
ncbi:MAG: division/cell wall cluster transcriptional repressor MraZ [Caldilineaceae bacterium]|nr:division/cell wall cluster transcriptional repressor MraZ [Caldilineaceae bacterium]